MLRQQTAMMSPPSTSRSVTVRGSTSGDPTASLITLGRMAGNRGVNVNLQDNRSSLNPHVFANKMV